jgi:ribonucleoside-triphosphate reductase
VALNLPQIAYMAKYSENDNWQEFFKILESRIRISQDILDIHRETLQKLIKNGNLPMYTYGCMDLTKQYSTIGFIGLFEAL